MKKMGELEEEQNLIAFAACWPAIASGLTYLTEFVLEIDERLAKLEQAEQRTAAEWLAIAGVEGECVGPATT